MNYSRNQSVAHEMWARSVTNKSPHMAMSDLLAEEIQTSPVSNSAARRLAAAILIARDAEYQSRLRGWDHPGRWKFGF